MTDRKKTTSRATTVRRTATSQSFKAGKTEKSVKASTDEKTEKSVKASADEKAEKSVKSSADERTDKAVKASARETTRREPTKQENKTPLRRDAKGSTSLAKRLRSNRIGSFLYEAYYELRYKVTWPTFREARNMTLVVIALSAVIGIILSGADIGLHRLFLFIVGAQ
jgi:preprotein translocase SecE subunit